MWDQSQFIHVESFGKSFVPIRAQAGHICTQVFTQAHMHTGAHAHKHIHETRVYRMALRPEPDPEPDPLLAPDGLYPIWCEYCKLWVRLRAWGGHVRGGSHARNIARRLARGKLNLCCSVRFFLFWEADLFWVFVAKNITTKTEFGGCKAAAGGGRRTA